MGRLLQLCSENTHYKLRELCYEIVEIMPFC
jgi:hypothetical protein